jgi:hypothetical protein
MQTIQSSGESTINAAVAMVVHLSIKSRNGKVGPIPVSTTTAASCWHGCAFFESCYAKNGYHLAQHWNQVTDGSRGTDWGTFCSLIALLPPGTAWRHNQAGDLPGIGAKIDADLLAQLVAANSGRMGWTYTHKPMSDPANRAAVAHANENGFVVNLSADTLAQADELSDLQIAPVCVVLDAPEGTRESVFTPAGRRVVVCPATYRADISCGGGKVSQGKGKKSIMTSACKLCARGCRKVIVGFPAHGNDSKAAAAVARGESR